MSEQFEEGGVMENTVVLLPSFAQVDWWRKRAASEAPAGLFAKRAATFNEWISDLWELHGDGRAIVDGFQREMLLFASAGHLVDEETARAMVPVAAECMRKASGLAEFEDVVDAVRREAEISCLSERERVFVRIMAHYEDLLRTCGLVEFGEATVMLARKGHEMFPQGVHVLMPIKSSPTWVQNRFFELCDTADVKNESTREADVIGRAPQGVEVRFAFPSGALAEPGLIADIIEGHGADASVVVTCVDPLDLFDRLAVRFGDKRRLSVQARRPFGQTDFGRAFIECYQCVYDDPWNPALLSDILIGPFSGMPRVRAVEVDAQLRADRLAQRDEVLQAIRAESEVFSQLEELTSSPDADVLIGAFEQRVQAAARRSPAWKAEQMAAMGALHRVMSAARMAGTGMKACVETLGRVLVTVAITSAGAGANVEASAGADADAYVGVGADAGTGADADTGANADASVGAQVLITTQSGAAQLEPKSVDVVVAADLTAGSYPVADRDDAVSGFCSKLGLNALESALERVRREFNELLELPRQGIVLMRPLGDDDADKTHPAVVLEEFVDAYRVDASATDDIDNEYRLPKELQEGMVVRGEEQLYANAHAAKAGVVQSMADEGPAAALEELAPGDEARVLRRRPDDQGDGGQVVRLSPSQIESYLECPFKWFAERRLRLDTVDEGFGPLERGSFAHAAFEEFYRRFQESGHAKVCAGNLEEARDVMREVTQELVALQSAKEPGTRYAAVTELEHREVEGLCRQLVSYLDFEAQLLPTFHPAYLEYALDADHMADYAGCKLMGRVDRIDVDDAGHAVIIDYKGSVNQEHEISGKGKGHAGKVQTRIYAQVVKRMLGLDVVAALYVSYGRIPAVSGAYDPRVVEALHLPGVKVKKCSCGLLEEVPDYSSDAFSLEDLTFEAMLDETEAIATQAVDAMKAGEIGPRPSYPDACKYCPVIACEERQG